MDRLFCMQVFVRVVEHGAFTRAADALGIARASATAAIAQLEKRLGVRLLHRTTRRLSVTDEGQSYYAHCVRILDEIAEAEDGLSGSRMSARGRLRVSVPQSFVNTIFFPGLREFVARHPALEIEVVLTDRAVNLVEEGIDCAIRGLEIPPDSSLVARRLSPARWLTCAAPAYLAKHGTPGSVDELASHNCIRFVSPSTGRVRDWMFSIDGLECSYAPRGNARLTSYDAAAHLALAGVGIVQMPDALGFGAVLNGTLQPILVPYVADAPPLMLVYPGNRYLTAKVRAFSEFFASVFPREGWWDRIVTRDRAA